MLDSTAPIPLDHQLPADAYWHLIRTLRLTLPPPPGDSPDDLRKRDHAAIACIAALAPGNAIFPRAGKATRARAGRGGGRTLSRVRERAG